RPALIRRVTRKMFAVWRALVHVMGDAIRRDERDTIAGWRDRVAALAEEFAREFPERQDRLTLADCASLLPWMAKWKRLLSSYDLVQAYAVDGIICLLAGAPYVAFEHGTIRTIPYEDSSLGRRTALTYRMAAHVFVTNIDCVASAERLAPGRFTLI